MVRLDPSAGEAEMLNKTGSRFPAAVLEWKLTFLGTSAAEGWAHIEVIRTLKKTHRLDQFPHKAYARAVSLVSFSEDWI